MLMKAIKRLFKVIFFIVALLLIGFLILVFTEFRPKDAESMEVLGESKGSVSADEIINIISWNIGYAGLGKEEDFFMDGGTGVFPKSQGNVEKNIQGICDFLQNENADIALLQEIDYSSRRTRYMNEINIVSEALNNLDYAYARNYKCLFVPFPFPPLGKMDSGIVSFSRYGINEATRYQLPIPFKWPVSIANLKRCLLETRFEIEGSDKELVIYNFHLEAYDSGEGKAAQTKMLMSLLNTEREKGNYIIAGGDLNQTFSGYEMSYVPDESKTGLWMPGVLETGEIDGDWQFLMADNVPSGRSLDRAYDKEDSTFLYYLIDGFIVSDNIKVNSIENVDLGFEYADHNPIRLEVTIQ